MSDVDALAKPGGETRKTEFQGVHGALAAALEMPSGKPKAFALFAHCFSCSKDIKAAREVARALRAQGVAVLRFDFAGLGASEGDFAETTFTTNVLDLLEAADFLRREFEAPSILIGHSLGGAATIAAATQIPEVKGVVTIGAPAEAVHVAHQFDDKREVIDRDGEAEVSLAGRPFRIKKQFLEDLENQDVLGCAKRLDKPLLVLHAPLDDTVGIENASEIFGAAKHPKSFVSLDTADHLLTRTEDARYVAVVIAGWAARYVENITPSLNVSPGGAAAVARGGLSAPANGAAAQARTDKKVAVDFAIGGGTFAADADVAAGGEGGAPTPTEYTLGALAACTGVTLRLYAARKGWELKDVRVNVRPAPDADPHAAKTLEKTVEIEGDLDDGQLARLHEIADRCPVHRILSEPVAIIRPDNR